LAAVNHVYAAVAGLATPLGRYRTNLFFAIFALAAAWYAFWVGLLGAGVLDAHPGLRAMSLLCTGYAGPALFLFTLSITSDADAPVSRLPIALLACGGFGTWFAVALFLDPRFAADAWESYTRGRMFEVGILWYVYLAHSGQLAFFFAFSIVRAAWICTRRTTPPEIRRAAGWIVAAICIGLAALAMTNALPHIWPGLATYRFGSLATIPAIFLVYYSLFDSRREILALRDRHEGELRAEQERIAADIHDTVGSELSALILELELARDRFDREKLTRRIREILNQLRELVYMMREPVDIEDSLREYAHWLRETGRFTVRLAIDPSQSRRLSLRQRHHIQQIVAGLITNIIRHSRATEVQLGIRTRPDRLLLYVGDNGRGFYPDRDAEGAGLRIARKRGKELHGRFRIFSRPGRGTVVVLRLVTRGAASPHGTHISSRWRR
ncbi:MAG: histidine kinase, partial [Leptospirales bacterium]